MRFYVRCCVVDHIPIFQKAYHVLLFPNFNSSMKESFISVSIYESCIFSILSLSLSLEITFHLKCFIIFGKASNLLFSSLRIMAQLINTKLDILKLFIRKSDLLVGIPKHLLIRTFDERFKSFQFLLNKLHKVPNEICAPDIGHECFTTITSCLSLETLESRYNSSRGCLCISTNRGKCLEQVLIQVLQLVML